MDSPIRVHDRPASWWNRLDRLFDAVCALPEAQRSVFVQLECADDAELRAELISLLAYATTESAPQLSLAGFLSRTESPSRSAQHEAGSRIGTTLRHFAIEALLGGGGMGTVYQARDVHLDRKVALKFLSPALCKDASSKERFLVEGRAGAAIDHANICTVYEVGTADDGTPFIAMAYYEGETLKSKVSRGPMPVDEAVDYVLQTANGVRAAHACGVLHRDIKPGNIFVTSTGVAKLLDFGVAKKGDLVLTKAGMALGTIGYMSPEQLCGGPVDARTDIWSLGVVLFEALVSHPPFRGQNYQQIRRAALMDQPPPIRVHRPEAPLGIDTVVSRALAKHRKDRHPTVAHFLDELRAAMEFRGESESGVQRAPYRDP